MLITPEKLDAVYPDLGEIYREADQKITYEESCSHCNATKETTKLKACSACSRSPTRKFYCSRACQGADWFSHRTECQDTQETYRNRDPMSKYFKEERRAFKVFAIALQVNISVFHWVSRQAFMANPQHDPRKTVFEITYTRYQIDDTILAPFFPLKYRFMPMTLEQHASVASDPDNDDLGYFILEPPCGSGIRPIKHITQNLDFMDRITPQWPYIFATVAKEKETFVDRATTKLVALVQMSQALNKPGIVGAPLENITCGKFDGVWELDWEKFMHWEKVVITIF